MTMATGGPSHAKPISWPASEYWDGADGNWSTFSLRIGSSNQITRVLPSTAGQALWAVSSKGCLPGEPGTSPSTSCDQSRGGSFNASESTSWKTLGNYTLGLELNLGNNHSATYGLDSVGLGLSNATGSPQIASQVVASFAANDYYVGLFGLGDQPTNFSSFDAPQPSFLSSLKTQNFIPSLSWGYTAGAHYRLKGVFGSLVFGGYDSSRIVHNDVSFSLAQDISRDILVSLQKITVNYANGSVAPFLPTPLPTPIWTFIDSTTPDIYLPSSVCQTFEDSFGLQWDPSHQRYYVSDSAHEALVAANPNITFQIGNSAVGGPTVDIVLPYASFDLALDYPLTPGSLPNATSSTLPPSLRYFPLVRAANDSQYTLGRTFLQEAYLVKNYEESTFSVYQTRFEDNVKEHITTIPATNAKPHGHINRATQIGLSIGIAVFVLLSLLAAVLAYKRRRKAHGQHYDRDERGFLQQKWPTLQSEKQGSLQELDTNSMIKWYGELPDSGKVELLDVTTPSGSGHDIPELYHHSVCTVHELMAHRDSDGSSGVQVSGMDEIRKTVVSIDIAEDSLYSARDQTKMEYDESTISSQQISTPDLDRSLPSTPGFQDFHITVKDAKPLAGDAALWTSIVSPFEDGEDRSTKRKKPRKKYPSMEMEVVIPPTKPSYVYNRGMRRSFNFF